MNLTEKLIKMTHKTDASKKPATKKAAKPTKPKDKKAKPAAKSPTKIKPTKLKKSSYTYEGLHAESPKINGIDNYTVQSAARAFAEVEEHKKNPQLMEAVKTYIENVSDAIKS